MQEKDPILRERELDGYRSIAQKIRNRLHQLDNANDKDKRRWVWELLQNAIDAGNNKPVDITIEINADNLSFQHNGGYFLPRSVTNLVHQISSKEGSESVGRFGTGFLTTHTLSRKVEVESIFENKDTFFPFKLEMDRTGSTEEALVLGIEKTWDLYKNAAQQSALSNPSPSTTFKYLEPNLVVAQETLNDAIGFMPYCFAFVPLLNTFSVRNTINNINILFEKKDTFKLGENLSILSFEKTEGEVKTTIQLFCIAHNSMTLAIEVQHNDTETTLLPIGENTPRIFCAYPLIGTEDFTFPFVLNSPHFSPKTERDKLYLKGETPDATHNKNLLKEALNLYNEVITCITGHQWKDIWRVIPNSLPPKDDDFDSAWYATNIHAGIKHILLNSQVVENQAGELKYIRKGQEFCYFPNHEKEEVRDNIWQYGHDLMPQQLPAKKHLNEWYQITKEWQDCELLTVEKLIIIISSYSNVHKLAIILKKNEEESLNWLNDLVGFIEKEQPLLLEKYAILPNQYGIFCKKNELYGDRDGIEDVLKDILLELGEDWRKEFLNNTITKANLKGKVRSRYNIIQTINGIIDKNENHNLIRPTDSKIRRAISMLASLYNQEDNAYRKDIYAIAKAFDKTIGDRTDVPTLSNDAWIKADKWLLQAIIADIENCKELSALMQLLELPKEESLDILNRLFIFLLESGKLELLSEKPVYPNQDEVFLKKSELFADINLSKALKTILKDLETLTFPTQTHKGWEHILLHKSITAFEQKHQLQTKTLKGISARINELLRNIPKNANKQYRNLILRLLGIGKIQEDKQKTIWEFSRTLYGDDAPEKIEILADGTDLDISVCLDWVMTRIAIDIESNEFVETLQKELFGNIQAIDWLNRVIDFLQRHSEWKHLLEDYAIIPNQNEDFCKLSALYIDQEIPPLLKKVIKSFNYEWTGELIHESIYILLPSVHKRTKDDAASEINTWFRNYHDSKEDPKFVGIWRNLQQYFKQEKEEYLQIHFDWVHRHKAEITVATLGDDEQKDNILQIIESGNAKIFNQIAKGLSESQMKELADNPQEFTAFQQWKENKTKEDKNEYIDRSSILNELSTAIGVNIDSWEKLIEDLIKANRKINFAQFPTPSVQNADTTDWAAIAKSNEEAREALYTYLGSDEAKALGYDRSAWNQQSNTIITGVKRLGFDLKMVIKGAKNGTVYFDNDKKEQKALLEPFSELWVFDGKKPFEITIGDMIDVWNMVGMKTYMFDFTKSS